MVKCPVIQSYITFNIFFFFTFGERTDRLVFNLTLDIELINKFSVTGGIGNGIK